MHPVPFSSSCRFFPRARSRPIASTICCSWSVEWKREEKCCCCCCFFLAFSFSLYHSPGTLAHGWLWECVPALIALGAHEMIYLFFYSCRRSVWFCCCYLCFIFLTHRRVAAFFSSMCVVVFLFLSFFHFAVASAARAKDLFCFSLLFFLVPFCVFFTQLFLMLMLLFCFTCSQFRANVYFSFYFSFRCCCWYTFMCVACVCEHICESVSFDRFIVRSPCSFFCFCCRYCFPINWEHCLQKICTHLISFCVIRTIHIYVPATSRSLSVSFRFLRSLTTPSPFLEYDYSQFYQCKYCGRISHNRVQFTLSWFGQPNRLNVRDFLVEKLVRRVAKRRTNNDCLWF